MPTPRSARERTGRRGHRAERPASQGSTEAELRELRYGATAGRGLRATGHTASDQVETILYRLVSSGNAKGIKPKREDGVVRPLLEIWREDTVRYCEEHEPRLPHRLLERVHEARPRP